MKKLLLAMALLVTSQSQASIFGVKVDYVRTNIRCVSAQDANVTYARTINESKDGVAPSVEMLDYKFWPQHVGEDKRLIITASNNDVVTEFNFGPGDSSATTFPLVMKDGDKYYCNILMTKYTERAPISLPF
ncbi:MAG: hypothetical protein JSU04_00510 [Bdellovibrionales bacterium]|nr:hypothetical protein [Bdellovibrionales bacterium]